MITALKAQAKEMQANGEISADQFNELMESVTTLEQGAAIELQKLRVNVLGGVVSTIDHYHGGGAGISLTSDTLNEQINGIVDTVDLSAGVFKAENMPLSVGLALNIGAATKGEHHTFFYAAGVGAAYQ